MPPIPFIQRIAYSDRIHLFLQIKYFSNADQFHVFMIEKYPEKNHLLFIEVSGEVANHIFYRISVFSCLSRSELKKQIIRIYLEKIVEI